MITLPILDGNPTKCHYILDVIIHVFGKISHFVLHRFYQAVIESVLTFPCSNYLSSVCVSHVPSFPVAFHCCFHMVRPRNNNNNNDTFGVFVISNLVNP